MAPHTHVLLEDECSTLASDRNMFSLQRIKHQHSKSGWYGVFYLHKSANIEKTKSCPTGLLCRYIVIACRRHTSGGVYVILKRHCFNPPLFCLSDICSQGHCSGASENIRCCNRTEDFELYWNTLYKAVFGKLPPQNNAKYFSTFRYTKTNVQFPKPCGYDWNLADGSRTV